MNHDQALSHIAEPVCSVRRITASDGAVLQGLYVAALRDAPHSFGSREPRPPEYFAQVAARHALSDTSTTFLMAYGAIPVGMIAADRAMAQTDADATDSAQRGYVSALWVSFRHRREGLGGQLLNAACQWLWETDVQEVCAWIAPENVQVVGFYEQHGFRLGSTLIPSPPQPVGTDQVYSRTRPISKVSFVDDVHKPTISR